MTASQNVEAARESQVQQQLNCLCIMVDQCSVEISGLEQKLCTALMPSAPQTPGAVGGPVPVQQLVPLADALRVANDKLNGLNTRLADLRNRLEI
jgi:hypothetical protein